MKTLLIFKMFKNHCVSVSLTSVACPKSYTATREANLTHSFFYNFSSFYNDNDHPSHNAKWATTSTLFAKCADYSTLSG